MTDKTNYDPSETMIVIDIAKQSHDALISWSSGKTKEVKITKSLAGYQRLLEIAGEPPVLINVGFEPTADYHRNINSSMIHVSSSLCITVYKKAVSEFLGNELHR